MSAAGVHQHRPIVPPYLLVQLEHHPSPTVQASAAATLATDAALRAAGRLPAPAAVAAAVPAATRGRPSRTVFDAQHTQQLPGEQVRAEGEPAVEDVSVNEAYDGLGRTWQLFWDAFGRDSLDDAGMTMLGTVHYGRLYANAFWDGQRMVFGDGDGEVFNRFTAAADVIAHELTHGIIELTSGLVYQGQSGALNESVSDVFGSLAKQHALGESAESADWLIGSGLFTSAVQGVALRSLKAPGTAYDDDVIGKDPQPATMADYVETTSDYGGVHINSGIPNHAFYLAAVGIGGNAWEGAGQVWYDVLTGGTLATDADFAAFADATVAAAVARFGEDSAESGAIRSAWERVGVLGAAGEGEPAPPAGGHAAPDEPTPVPDTADDRAESEALVYLCRTGGFGGFVRECTFRPAELTPPESTEWSSLLGARTLGRIASTGVIPDSYVYRVVVEQQHLDITFGEHDVDGEVRSLFERTLQQG